MPVSAPVAAALVLLHSPLVGPLTWRAVAAELEAAGIPTVVPSLAGHSDHAGIIEAVVEQVSTGREATPIVLVGHSGAGPLLPAIADAVTAINSGTVEALIYVDAGLPRPGRTWFDDAPSDLAGHLRERVSDDDLLPPWDEWFGADTLADLLPDSALRRSFIAELPRLPLAYFTEPAPAATWSGPAGYLLLSEAYRHEAERMRHAGVSLVTYLSDHLAMLTHPAPVAAALRNLVGRVRDRGGREQRLAFGEVADDYDEVRAAYPAALYDALLGYAGAPLTAVEVGAGTGKATGALLARGVAVTCIEPDPAMAAILRRQFGDAGASMNVVAGRFEDWRPPVGGVPLLVCSQSWHWLDPATRCYKAHAALRPGGALALFGHRHAFADRTLEAALNCVYAEVAPELLDEPGQRDVSRVLTDELAGSRRFTDIIVEPYEADLPYPTHRYLRLLGTFSNHRMLPPDRRAKLHDRIAEVVDAHGGSVTVRLDTTMVLARRV